MCFEAGKRPETSAGLLPGEMNTMIDRLTSINQRYDELADLLGSPEVVSNAELLQKYGRERASLEPLAVADQRLRSIEEAILQTKEMIGPDEDAELVELAQAELEDLEAKREATLSELRSLLVPKDPNDEKDTIVEIRAGTGGQEAALFAADLYRMYARYAERQGWQAEVIDAHDTGLGGFKEIVFEIHGRGAYSHLKYESGVHRVQRVPSTEASGRLHTSAATVAVLPEVEEVELEIAPDDLRIDIYRSSGAGGQHVNKVNSAVRITHLPTGIVVTCQDERSQLKNRVRAMTHLRAKLFAIEQEKKTSEIEKERRSQVKSGDRSEKIRTYNFPRDRLTDHRIGLTTHGLPRILDGELDNVVEALSLADQQRREAENALALSAS